MSPLRSKEVRRKAWSIGLMMPGEGPNLLHASPLLVAASLWLLLFAPFHDGNAQVATANNPHGKIKIACNDCHTTKGWSPLRLDLKFKHEKTGFALEGQHAVVECKQCHASLKFTGASKDCKSCHQDVHNGTLGQDCERCHTFQSWRDVSKVTVVHQSTRFPLLGRHQHVGCDNCHAAQGESKFINMPLQCGVCHRQDYEATANPNHQLAGFSLRCEICHSSAITGWQISGTGDLSGFDHSRTRFPLLGAHAAATCNQCHTNNRFAGTPTDCFSCHQTNFQKTTNPNHVAGNFSKNCEICHGNNAWQPASFDHDRTAFPLAGAHRTVECAQCHLNNKFAGTPKDCFSCHQADFQRPMNPNHVASNFPHDCQMCHTINAWLPANFDHNRTQFPLTGAHLAVVCTQCHVNNQFAGTPTDCFSCHQSDFQGTTNPNHAAANFSHTCTSCHTTSAWKPSTFNHNTTAFPLQGAHITVACSQCHVNNRFAGTPKDCFSCHQTDFQKPVNPNHVASNFPHDCLMCHTINAWRPANFDHNRTRFPLTGAHLAVVCTQCHVNNQFAGTPTDCFSCHQSDFQGTTNPNHAAANFSHTCTSCHTTSAWKPSTFNHSATAFPLQGAHVTVACSQCHVNNRFAGTPKDCFSCHQTDFQRPTNPNHVASNFPHDCLMCHTINAWLPANFDHNRTQFPLTGAHLAVACDQCHANNRFTGTPKDCFSCHQSDFQSTTNPNHVAANFSQTCTSCHTTSAWKPATFDHNKTRFPLLGAHTTAACALCHVNNRFAGTPMDCFSCHQADFQRPTNPNHVTLNFSHDCTSCHTVNAWTPATFDHDGQYFRIYSGKHRGKWQTCATCHVNATNYKVFECILCHEHNQTSMDSKHQGKQNYQYNSQACYNCHQRA